MDTGARTPEELETLLEDAFVLHDQRALPQLFQPAALLVAGGGLPAARGHQQITQLATRLWNLDRSYLANPRRVHQTRHTALVLGHAINVAHRGDDGFWRYTISLLDPDQASPQRSPDLPP
jgi:hypothetical protein